MTSGVDEMLEIPGKSKLYLDTSLFGSYYDEGASKKRALTRKFFDEELVSGKYEVFSSEVVLRELTNCSDPALQADLVKFALTPPVTYLSVTAEVSELAKKFVDDGFISVKKQAVALHLAFALIHSLDYIISWNFKYIVKPKIREAVKTMAVKESLKEPKIITPQEIVESRI
jgi:hypothetical protein